MFPGGMGRAFFPFLGYPWSTNVVAAASVKRALGGIVIALGVATAVACGEGEETCTCTCTCGSGTKSKLSGATSIETCSNLCDTECGSDSFTSSYDCKTEG